MIRFILNEKEIETALPPGTLLLDFIRYHRHLMGTKIGCREGDCGACTVLVGELQEGSVRYRSATSCLMAIGNAVGKHIVTVEGVNLNGDAMGEQKLNVVQQLFADEGASQCGFCTPGFIVSLAGYCLNHTESAVAAIDGNICRCTGYKSIERAAAKLEGLLKKRDKGNSLDYLIEASFLPNYFKNIRDRLRALPTNGSVKTSTSEKLLGGGTDLYVQQPETMAASDIEFVFDKKTFKGIHKEGNNCVIGASATVTDLLESEVIRKYFPEIKKYIGLISSTQIRNMATVAGNFVNASPIGDLTIFFLALDAQIILSDGANNRELPLRNFFKGYKNLDKTPTEFVEKIWFTLPDENTLFNFEKVSKRTHLDIASVNSAIAVRLQGNNIQSAAISAGGVGPVPMYLSGTSAHFTGKEISNELIEQAIEIAQSEISPISDVRGSAEYKRLLLSQLIKAHFIQMFPQLEADALINTLKN